jgi:hypothetical protein
MRLQMNHQDYPRRMISMNGAVQALFETIYDMLKECDEMRVNTDVPDPTELSSLGNYFTTINDAVWEQAPLGQMLERLAEKRHPEWLHDWLSRGWIDSGSGRSVSSPCNSYVAMSDAIEEIENDCYDHDNGKASILGKCRSRHKNGYDKRNRGNQPSTKPAPIGGPRGRPKKETKRRIGGQKWIFRTATEARHGTGQRGRPKGAKDGRLTDRYKRGVLSRRLKKGDRRIIIGPNGLPI